MDLRLGDGDDPALLSANLLNLFDTFVILVFVPIFDSCIYPAWERWTGKTLRPIAKMQAGFIFCVRGVRAVSSSAKRENPNRITRSWSITRIHHKRIHHKRPTLEHQRSNTGTRNDMLGIRGDLAKTSFNDSRHRKQLR